MSDFRVEALRPEQAPDWDAWVDAAWQPLVYHRLGWLQAMAAASGMPLTLLVVYKGDQRAGLLPLFLRRNRLFTGVFSPPPGLAVAELGPLLCQPPAAQRLRAEKDCWGVSQACMEWIEAELAPDLLRIRLGARWPDPRPFIWAGCRAEPLFAYHRRLDVDADTLWRELHRDNRNKLKRIRKQGLVELAWGGAEEYRQLHRLVRARYAEQGMAWSPPEAYLEALWAALGPDILKVHVALQDGVVVAGNLYARYGDCLCFWIGGFRPPRALNGVNEWLLWEAFSEAAGELAWADLGGGNTPHLCDYKARYNPQLVTHYALEKLSRRGELANRLLESDRLRSFLKRLR